ERRWPGRAPSSPWRDRPGCTEPRGPALPCRRRPGPPSDAGSPPCGRRRARGPPPPGLRMTTSLATPGPAEVLLRVLQPRLGLVGFGASRRLAGDRLGQLGLGLGVVELASCDGGLVLAQLLGERELILRLL